MNASALHKFSCQTCESCYSLTSWTLYPIALFQFCSTLNCEWWACSILFVFKLALGNWGLIGLFIILEVLVSTSQSFVRRSLPAQNTKVPVSRLLKEHLVISLEEAEFGVHLFPSTWYYTSVCEVLLSFYCFEWDSFRSSILIPVLHTYLSFMCFRARWTQVSAFLDMEFIYYGIYYIYIIPHIYYIWNIYYGIYGYGFKCE